MHKYESHLFVKRTKYNIWKIFMHFLFPQQLLHCQKDALKGCVHPPPPHPLIKSQAHPLSEQIPLAIGSWYSSNSIVLLSWSGPQGNANKIKREENVILCKYSICKYIKLLRSFQYLYNINSYPRPPADFL